MQAGPLSRRNMRRRREIDNSWARRLGDVKTMEEEGDYSYMADDAHDRSIEEQKQALRERNPWRTDR